MTFTIMGLAFGSVGIGINSVSEQPWWVALIIAVVPTLIGIIWDIIRNQGTKKGWFNEKTATKIDKVVDNVVEDIKDDGKLNNSNKDTK